MSTVGEDRGTVLVIGGAEHEGSAAIRHLRDRGLAVRALLKEGEGATAERLAALGAEPVLADPEDLGYFLCKVFDEWHRRDIGKHFVNLIETSVAVWAGLPPQVCVFSEICGKAVVLERDGSLYSCDHYAYPEYRLGNIRERSLREMIFSERQTRFGLAKSNTLPSDCRACPVRFACWGECPRNRFVKTAGGEPGLNYFCPAFKRFFTHIDAPLRDLVKKMRL